MNILIIGLGNLGRRHLESLKFLSFSCIISAVDLSDPSIENTKKLLSENIDFKKHAIKYFNSIESVQINEFELAIIATNSNERFKVLKELFEYKKVKNVLLEKFLFPRIDEYQQAEDIINSNLTMAWVNCPRRMFPEFQEMKKYFSNSEGASFSAVGNAWGLGCNAIHALDLFAYLVDDSDFIFSNELLEPKIYKSDRSGYLEFSGSIVGISSKRNYCKITSTGGVDNKMPAIYSISNERAHFIIHRGYKSYFDYALAEENWEWKKGEIKTPYQSEITYKIVEKIKNNTLVELTTFEESAKLHKSILLPFIDHAKKHGIGLIEGECMIS